MSDRDSLQQKANTNGTRTADAQGGDAGSRLHSDPAMSRALLQRRVQRRAATTQAAPPVAGADTAHAGSEGPSSSQADSAVIHALQSHMRLSATRMYAVSANMRTILAQRTNTDAGTGPIIQGLQQQFDVLLGDLDLLLEEVGRVPELMRGAMSEEIGLLTGAFHDSNGFAMAMQGVYSYTHDKDGNLTPDAAGTTISTSTVQMRMTSLLGALHLDAADVVLRTLPRGTDIAAAVQSEASSAVDDSLNAMQLCARRISADLDSLDEKDANAKAAELLAVASAATAAAKGIHAKNAGTAKKAVHEVETMQADLAKRSGPKAEALARRIGYNTRLSSELHALHQRIEEAAKESGHR